MRADPAGMTSELLGDEKTNLVALKDKLQASLDARHIEQSISFFFPSLFRSLALISALSLVYM